MAEGYEVASLGALNFVAANSEPGSLLRIVSGISRFSLQIPASEKDLSSPLSVLWSLKRAAHERNREIEREREREKKERKKERIKNRKNARKQSIE